MKGLTLTQAHNIEEVLTELERECEAARKDFGATNIRFEGRRENVEQFCKDLREVLG